MDAKSPRRGRRAASHESPEFSPAQAITQCLEDERHIRQQLYRFGIPGLTLFFCTGLSGFNPLSVFFLLVVIVVLCRFILLPPTRVDRRIDERVALFGNAVQAFRVQRYLDNYTSGDRIRVLSRRTYRRLKWPFPVIILEQRWKKTNGQLFLIIGPSGHWWSGGNIWSQWKWAYGRNAELNFSKRTVSARKQFLLDIHLDEGLVWSLNFKSTDNRDQAYEALNIIRKVSRRPTDYDEGVFEPVFDKSHDDDTVRASSHARPHGSTERGHVEDQVEEKTWYEVIGVKRDASVQDIQAAYKNAMKKCHPDTVADRSEIIRRAAASEAVQLNVAYESAKTERGF